MDDFKPQNPAAPADRRDETTELVRSAVQRAMASSGPVFTGFLSPDEREVVMQEAARYPGVRCRVYGGYRGAARAKVAIMPGFYVDDNIDPGIAGVVIYGDVVALPIESLLARLGVAPDKVGDIAVFEDECHIVIDRDAARAVADRVSEVASVPVSAEAVDVLDLRRQNEEAKKVIRSVASLRLDAVASAGYGASRTKMAQDIKAGKVSLNRRVIMDPAEPVKAGDVIMMKGKGRLVIDAVGVRTKKGRINVEMTRIV